MKLPKTHFVLIAVIAAVVLWIATGAIVPAVGFATPAFAAGPGSQEQAAASAPKGGDYVGSAACIECHEQPHNLIKDTPMGRVLLAHPRTDKEKLGCEGCHGPGKAHVDTPTKET